MVDTVLDGFSAAATLTGAEEFIAVQSAAAVNPTATQIQMFAHKFPIEATPSAPTAGVELYAQVKGDARLHMRTPNSISRLETDWTTGYEFIILPNNAATVGSLGSPVVTSGTITNPLATTTAGRIANVASAGAAGSTAGLSATVQGVFAGNATGPYRGWSLNSVLTFPDATYNEVGASTGKRIFVGVSDQAFTVPVLADDPAGNHAGFFRCHVNGGLLHTNWQFMTKNAPTISIVDTGLVFNPASMVEFFIFSPPGSATVFWSIRDITNNSAWFSGSTSTNTPSSTAILRPGFQIAKVEAATVINTGLISFRARGLINQI